MTIRISLRAVAFVVYTLALLGGAFGISYAVFEWRDHSPDATKLSEIEERLDGVDTGLSDANDRIGSLSTDFRQALSHSHDDCGGKVMLYVVAYVSFINKEANFTQADIDEVNERSRQMGAACR